MFNQILSPEPGNRTYRLMLLSFMGAFVIAMTGIVMGRDLTGLALVVGAFAASVSGMAALNNRGVARNPIDNGKDA